MEKTENELKLGPVLLSRQLGRLVGGSWLKAKVRYEAPKL